MSVLRVRLVGAVARAEVVGEARQAGKINYIIRGDPGRWRVGVETFGRVRYRRVYPGVDVVYYGEQGRLEYDFQVAAGADAGAIALEFEGAEGLEVDGRGDLVLRVGGGEVVQRRPVVYQVARGVRKIIAGEYVVRGKNRVGFRLGEYDRTRPLVIDPVLVFSTYLGGAGGEEGLGVAVDSADNAYVVGSTASLDFPATVGAFQAARGGTDLFISKLNATGTGLVYSTYVGGAGDDFGFGVAVDAQSRAYVTGATNSSNFPVTAGAPQAARAGGSDAFVARLSPDGAALEYATYIGGNNDDAAYAVAADAAGRAYITGATASPNFPATAGAMQTAFGGAVDAFVLKVNASGTSFDYSTFAGGEAGDAGFGIALDASGGAYVTGVTESSGFNVTPGALQATHGGGMDAFVTKLNAAGSAPAYSTFVGRGRDDLALGVASDADGSAFVAGLTDSDDFPVTASAFQSKSGGAGEGFVIKLNPAGSSLVYSTYLGGSGADTPRAVALDSAGAAYVAGTTTSPNFPVTPNAVQPSKGGGSDAFVTKLNPSGSGLLYSTHLGGAGDDEGFGLAVDLAGSAFVTGRTASANFPATPGALQSAASGGDAFAAKLILNDAGLLPNPVEETRFYVFQHYVDFLNRVPDAPGLQFWTGEVEQCGADAQCREVKRINVSAAFFLSIEFQETGYLVYRMYKAAYGDANSPNVPGTVPVVRLQEFLPDTQKIGHGVVVNQGDWQAQLESNKQTFALEFVQRQRFLAAYPPSLTSGQFVDKLNRNAGGVLTQAERDQLVTQLSSAADAIKGRAAALRQVAENAQLRQAEINRAFVLMQYYGYLRRNPDDPQDTDFRGWKFWLDKLNQFNGNFVNAEMVKAFTSSIEYRRRFGQP